MIPVINGDFLSFKKTRYCFCLNETSQSQFKNNNNNITARKIEDQPIGSRNALSHLGKKPRQ